ncbi:MAG: FGGY family carbohydrate kinase, partial [Rubrivivax sp.]
HAIVWQDRRGEPLCAQLRSAGLAPHIRDATGLVVDSYFSATKLRWLLDQVPGAREMAARGELAFGTVDSWLLWKLTGGAVHATDVTNASRTMLFDIRRHAWDDTLLDALQVPASVLPSVHASGHVYGSTVPGLLGATIPVAGLAGDQQSALFGQACFQAGLAKNTYGTGCFMLMHTGGDMLPSANGLIATSAAQWGAPGAGAAQYALEGSVFMGGAVVQWLRDGLQAIRSSGEVQALAESVADTGGVHFVPAFTGLGSPYWNPDARGAIVGLTRGSTTAHIARAALESIAFQSAALLQAMSRDAAAAGAAPVTELRVDGGACVNNLLMQFQADLLGIPVVRPTVTETTALGAAYLAGLAVGVWPDAQALAAQWQVERRFEPRMSRDEAAARMAGWERAVGQAVA